MLKPQCYQGLCPHKITEPVRMDEPVMAVEDTQHNIFSDAVDTLDNYNRAPVADELHSCTKTSHKRWYQQ